MQQEHYKTMRPQLNTQGAMQSGEKMIPCQLRLIEEEVSQLLKDEVQLVWQTRVDGQGEGTS